MSKKAYEILDLVVLTFIAALADGLDVFVFHQFGNQVYALSIAVVMGLFAIYRWNLFGLVVPVVAGAVSVAVRLALGQAVTTGLWLAYTVGYLFLGFVVLLYYKKDKSVLIQKKSFQALYVLVGFACVEIGRAICQIGNGDFWAIAGTYFALDLLNVLFGLAVFMIGCKQDHFVVDMNQYLIESHKNPTSANIRQEQKDSLKLETLAETDDINDAALLDGGTLSDEDLRAMNEPFLKSQHKTSRFDKENAAIRDYQNKKKEERSHL